MRTDLFTLAFGFGLVAFGLWLFFTAELPFGAHHPFRIEALVSDRGSRGLGAALVALGVFLARDSRRL